MKYSLDFGYIVACCSELKIYLKLKVYIFGCTEWTNETIFNGRPKKSIGPDSIFSFTLSNKQLWSHHGKNDTLADKQYAYNMFYN